MAKVTHRKGSGQHREADEPMDELYKELLIQAVAGGMFYEDAFNKYEDIIPQEIKNTYDSETYDGCNGRRLFVANLCRTAKGKKRLEHLRQIFIEDNINDAKLSFKQKRGLLQQIAMDESLSATVRMRAIEQDNKMSGEYAPEQHEVKQTVSVAQSILDKVRERKQDRVDKNEK